MGADCGQVLRTHAYTKIGRAKSPPGGRLGKDPKLPRRLVRRIVKPRPASCTRPAAVRYHATVITGDLSNLMGLIPARMLKTL